MSLFIRSDSADNWNAVNPVLRYGEASFDFTSGKIKIGNGMHNWSDLPFNGADVNALVSVLLDPILFIDPGQFIGNATLSVNLKNQHANYVFAGPVNGIYDTPTFRGLVESDLPFISINKINSSGAVSGQVLGFNGSTINWTNIQSGWGVSGNGDTNPSNNFIGTTDSKDFVLRTNNIERLRINAANGYVGIGTTNPLNLLHIDIPTTQNYTSFARFRNGNSGSWLMVDDYYAQQFGVVKSFTSGVAMDGIMFGRGQFSVIDDNNTNNRIELQTLRSSANNGRLQIAQGYTAWSEGLLQIRDNNSSTGYYISSNTNRDIGINIGAIGTATNILAKLMVVNAGNTSSYTTIGIRNAANTSWTFRVLGNGTVDIPTTTGALIVSRLTEIQRDFLSSPTSGMIIYNADRHIFQGYANGAWYDFN